MKYGARNQITGTVKSIKKDSVMSQVKIEINVPAEMQSVMTVDSLEELGLKEGDNVKVLVKAISVLVVKE